LAGLPENERKERFHVGKMIALDDFPMLWTWFEEDDLLEQMGKPRLHTDHAGYFKYPYLWDVLIKRIGLDYQKLARDKDLQDATVIIEFSREKTWWIPVCFQPYRSLAGRGCRNFICGCIMGGITA
jgi:hypothetical protein